MKYNEHEAVNIHLQGKNRITKFATRVTNQFSTIPYCVLFPWDLMMDYNADVLILGNVSVESLTA